MCFKQKQAISTLSGRPQKLGDKFIYLGRNNSSTESGFNIHPVKAWNTSDWLSIKWKFNRSDNIK